MNIEKFSTDEGVEGVKVSFKFTAQNNTNGVNFNPLSVFTQEAVSNAKLDLNHDFEYEKFDSSKTTWDLKNSTINKTEVEHEVFMESTDPNTVKIVTGEDFRGFSANLIPQVAPVPNRKANPRFYPDGGIVLESFTALTKGKPSFKGADKVLVETFSDDDSSGVTIIENSETEDKKKPEPEKFSFWGSVGSYAKTSSGQIGKVIKIEQLENRKFNYTLTLLDGTQLIVAFTGDWDTDRELLNDLSINDVMDYLVSQKSKESFEDNKTETTPPDPKNDELSEEDKKETEKFEQIKKETERFNSIAKAKQAINDTKLTQQGAGDNGVKSKPNSKAEKTLISKIL